MTSGFIEKARLPKLLALADALVQPGHPGPFNDYRLPSKLPEFLASGRPVILPATNIALEMRDGAEGLFLSSGTPENIADCCQSVFSDAALSGRLGQAGAAFARAHFDLETNTDVLLKAYSETIMAPERPFWKRVRETRGSDLSATAAELVGELRSTVEPERRPPSSPLPRTWRRSWASSTSAIRNAADLAKDGLRTQLEETLRHLQLERGLTSQHVQNLQGRIDALDRQMELQKKLSSRHIQNLRGEDPGDRTARPESVEIGRSRACKAGVADRGDG